MFEIPAGLFSWFHNLTDSYMVAIALMAAVVMAITTPLTLKSTKGMLEMQRLAPEMRKLQNEYRSDRQKLNEEMMKLYQEHKVNPLASCLPIAAQMPIFLIMFRLLRGLVYTPTTGTRPIAEATVEATGATDVTLGFIPRYLSTDTELYQSLFGRVDMPSLGLDLSRSAFDAIGDGFTDGLIYSALVVLLGALYFGQQRMVAARAAMSPTMSPAQQKLMQYLPVVFAVFQIFFLSALVVYYIFQTLLRILQQYYITRKFYGHDDALGRQAQRAGEAAREEAKKSGESGGLFAQAKRDLTAARGDGADADRGSARSKQAGGANGKGAGAKGAGAKGGKAGAKDAARPVPTSKRVTPPKNRPSTGAKGRPTPSRKEAQAARARSTRPKSSGKKRR